MNPFVYLPDELILNICDKMPNGDLVNITKSYSKIYQVCSDLLQQRKMSSKERRNAYTIIREVEGSKTKTYIRIYDIQDYKILSMVFLVPTYGHDIILITQALYNPFLSVKDNNLFISLAKQIPRFPGDNYLEGKFLINLSSFPKANSYNRNSHIYSTNTEQVVQLYRSLEGYIQPKESIHDLTISPNTYQ